MFKEVKTIEVTARRWFQKSFGNTYHTVVIVINRGCDDESIIESPITYGYDSHFKQTTWNHLIANGYDIPQDYFGFMDFLCELPIIWSVLDVDRKKDL